MKPFISIHLQYIPQFAQVVSQVVHNNNILNDITLLALLALGLRQCSIVKE